MATRSRRRAVLVWTGLRLLAVADRVLARFSTVENRPVYDTASFPWLERLEDNWQVIRAEADTALTDLGRVPPLRAISPDHDLIATDDRWRSFFLWAYDTRWERNCRRCPQTVRLLDGVPGLLSAFFSVLEPGAHIPRHTGPTKAILTAHLGLHVPGDGKACRMRVDAQDVRWQDGKAIVFDDMYPHEVWNDTDEPRVILLLHVKRPQRFPGTLVRDGLFAALKSSPFVQDGLRNLERWEEEAPAAPPPA